MEDNVIPLLDNEKGRAVVKSACDADNVRFDVFKDLINAYDEFGKHVNSTDEADDKTKRFNIYDDILDRILKGGQ
ncbi:MAG: hypothetical protein MJE68_06150 [Proteobacteria bacterium]|nr:hypothetical protein [Pseudomonadota bacterium]